MKFLFVATTIFLSLVASAQKNFEGIITYKLSAPDDEAGKTDSMTIVIAFGKNAIKVKSASAFTPNISELLIRIDSGKVFNISTTNSTYFTHPLLTAGKSPGFPSEKTLAGYKARVHKVCNDNIVFGALLRSNHAAVYVSEELTFSVPEKFKLARELVMLRDGKIVLGLSFSYPKDPIIDGVSEEQDDKEPLQAIFSIEAQEVKWLTLPDSEFQIPGGFREFNYNTTDSAVTSFDTTDAVLDTSVVVPPPENLPAPRPLEKSNSKSSKSGSGKSSKNSAARKPD
jgi:hypothetical protein